MRQREGRGFVHTLTIIMMMMMMIRIAPRLLVCTVCLNSEFELVSFKVNNIPSIIKLLTTKCHIYGI